MIGADAGKLSFEAADARITVVGGGKMGEAIFAGWIAAQDGPAAQWDASNFTVVEPTVERASYLRQAYGVACVDDVSLAPASDIVLLSVKPQVMASVLEVYSALGHAADALVISIAAGLSTVKLEAMLPEGSASPEEEVAANDEVETVSAAEQADAVGPVYSAAVTPMLSAAPSISPFTSTVPTVPIGAVAVFAPWLKKAGAICDGITAPVLAPLYSVENGTLTVDCFVSVRTTNAQAPEGIVSTATYRLGMDNRDGWTITEISGVGADALPDGPR